MDEPTSETTTTAARDARALVAEGNAALIAGDAYGARQRFRQALALDPERVEAWVGLAGSVRPYREKREHLQRALAIDPANVEARAVLVQVEARLAAGEVLAPGGVQVREPTPGLSGASAPAATGSPAATDTAPLPGQQPQAVTGAATDALFCYIHPDRETGLRCTSCDRPICGECAQRAAVGQLCPECAKARRPVNYQVSGGNLAVAGGVTVVYSIIASTLGLLLLGNIGFFAFIVAFLLGPVVGDLLVRIIDRLTRAKRGRTVQLTVGLAYGAGILFMLCGLAMALGALSIGVVGRLLISLPLGFYLLTAVAIVTALTRLR